jgi:DNA repair protein RadC
VPRDAVPDAEERVRRRVPGPARGRRVSETSPTEGRHAGCSVSLLMPPTAADAAPTGRPRERLHADGPRVLSDADLLALVPGTGTGKLSARAAALGLLEAVPLLELSWAPPDAIAGRPGNGEALRAVQVAEGSLSQCPVSPRDARRWVVREGASSVVFAHDHPSGVTRRPGSCGPRPARTRRRAIRCAIRSRDEAGAEGTP